MMNDDNGGSVGAARAVHENGVHLFPIRVYFEDTDAMGIVYYANYLKFAERARTEMLRGVGFMHSQGLDDERCAFVVRRCAAEFIKPARLDDLLEVHTRLIALRGAVLDLVQDIKRLGEDLVTLRLGLACVSAAGRPRRLPPALRLSLETLWQQDRLSG